ncbi:MAG: hypothetical protein JOZ78_23755 [Chroococcidiopsidaceae cyanobacterium CP_BM_ER_R8_30]|nr:hypothetical protein [Chroococcidiopsidaceae cyanobacterium CP_BM_ER_R8_30]
MDDRDKATLPFEQTEVEKPQGSYLMSSFTVMIPPSQPLKPAENLNYRPGDLVRIRCQAEAPPTQKVWNGCWGMVQSTDASVRVLVGGKEVDYLTSDLNWDENLNTQFRETCERILALWQTELEAIEQTVLAELQQRQSFTDLETQIVCFIEAKLSKASQRTRTAALPKRQEQR